MDIKQLSEVAGVSRSTLSRTAKSLFPGLIVKGKKTFFSDEQSLRIIEKVKKSNMVSKAVQNENVPVQNAQVDYDAIGKMIAVAVSAALSPVVEKLGNLSNQKALPEPIKQDSYSLVAYCKVKSITVNQSQLALHGRSLKKMTVAKNLKVSKLPDERWGFVNSYPLEILDEYFSA
jgi:hypothetical protein